MIAIIDYNAGNIRSVLKAFEYAGAECGTTSEESVIMKADAVVLPGVGAFRDCVNNLKDRSLDGVVKRCIHEGKPFFGICLGFQMLFDWSEEHGEDGAPVPGLGIFKGTVRQFRFDKGLKVPHMGWNCLEVMKEDPIFSGLPDKPYVYFVHSYYVEAADRSLVAARSDYGITFDAAISCGNVRATQFHPEKSGDVGIRMIKNFVKAVYSK
jgi:glutamine amidotransferase